MAILGAGKKSFLLVLGEDKMVDVIIIIKKIAVKSAPHRFPFLLRPFS